MIEIKNIFDLQNTGMFFIEPIIAWVIFEKRDINDKYYLIVEPIVTPWGSNNIDHYTDENTVKSIVSALDSYVITAIDDSDEWYYVHGVVSNYGEIFRNIQDFYDKVITKIKK